MPRLRNGFPRYSRHKSGQAVVRFASRDVYLGRFGSPESREAYDRLVAEWLANGRRAPDPAPAEQGSTSLTVDEIILRYLKFAEGHYRKNGEPTGEFGNMKDALRPVHALYGSTPAAEFGPRALKAVRAKMVEAGLSRGVINSRVGRIIRAFKWAASEELVPATVHQALRTVGGLQRGRTEARETEPVKPVPDAFADAIEPHVSGQVWAMVQLQRLTGMRPGEVMLMRSVDLDVSGKVWMYRPRTHKTEHRGRDRVVFLGPRAQAIVKPWLRANLEEYLFQPAEADAERKAELRASRKSRVQPSQVNRSKADPTRKPGECYTTNSYARAIARGCERAGVPSWSPNQLRHNAATLIRKEAGLDVAQVVLGHASPDTTLIYAEADHRRAAEIMLKLG